MYALRLGSRRCFLSPRVHRGAVNSSPSMVCIQQRNHVYDKRNYIPEFDDWIAVPTARAYDTTSMKLSQPRLRRLSQYMMWITTVYVSIGFFKYFVIRQQKNKVEKWDHQSKYWRDGYWIREFPEGIVIKEYKNGSYSLEPGQSQRPPLISRIMRKIFAVGSD